MIEETVLTQDDYSDQLDLHRLVESRFVASTTATETFFMTEADRISAACWSMARRFHAGGRLIAFGNGAWASDAQHVSVEFVHPVIVGKRALPALALTNESALLVNDPRQGIPFARPLSLLGRSHDIAIGFSFRGRDVNVVAALQTARQMGMLTLGLTGANSGDIARADLDYCFAVPSDDPMVVQETHETLYHILWELVHIFFEHEGLLNDSHNVSADAD